MPSISRRELLTRLGGGLGMAGAVGRAGCRRPSTNAAANPLAPQRPALRPEGEAGHLPVHERRAVARRYVRPQAGARQVRRPAAARALSADDRAQRSGKLMPSPFKFSQARPERDRGQRAVSRTSAERIDDLCVIRSMHTDIPNHEPGLLMMNSGNMQPIRPSLGSWLTYGLGTENQNLPGFVVLCPGKPVVGPQLWSNSFLPGIFQGTHINNKHDRSRQTVIRDVHNTLPRRRPPSASSSTCCKQLNRAAPGSTRPATTSSKPASQSLEMAFRMQFEAQEAFDLEPRNGGDPRALRRGRVRQRLPARPPAGRARRADGAGLLRQRPALGRPRRHHQPPQPRPGRATGRSPPCSHDLKARGLLDDTLVVWGGEFGRTPTSRRGQGPRPPQPRLHHVAGRRRRQGRATSTARPTSSASTPSRTASTSTTCTPRSCTCWASTTSS